MKPGHHIGDYPWDFDFDKMCDLHEQGWDTINATTYAILINEGHDPAGFRTWSPDQLQTVLDEAAALPNPDYCDLV